MECCHKAGCVYCAGQATKVFCVNVLTVTTSLILNNIWSNLPLTVKSGSTLNLIFPSHVQAISLVEMHPCPKLQLIGITFLLVLYQIHPNAALNKPFFLFETTCLCFRWICHQLRLQLVWLIVCLSCLWFYFSFRCLYFDLLYCTVSYFMCCALLGCTYFIIYFLLYLFWNWFVRDSLENELRQLKGFILLTFPMAGETLLPVHKLRNDKNDFETTALRQRNYMVLL